MAPQKRKFVAVASVLAFAMVVLGGVMWSSSGRITWALRGVALVTVVGLVFLMRALTKPVGRVLAHTACAHCKRQILFEHEGEICVHCAAGLHARCADGHRTSTHADGPFR